ncbi:MAG: T9SS type A sorting domain-containing protein [Bacteroidia bacterium]|nr:T9SS type A sorting domain-containing protein [Bacteroidia bacterium]
MKRVLLLLILTSPFISHGQLIFNRTFYGPPGSNQGAFSSTVDDAGNIYTVGTYKDTNPFHWLTLMKLDSAGNLLWSKANDLARSGRKIKKLSDNNILTLGLVYESTPPTNRSSSLLFKADTAGNILWSRVYFDTISFAASDFVELPDKGFTLTGGWYNINNQQEGRIFLMRTDSVGNVLWCKLYGNGYPGYYSRSVVTTHDGGFIVGGNMVDIEDIVVFRTDSLGNLIWSNQFVGAKGDYLESLISLSNGNYAFGGHSNSFIGTGSWPPFNQLLYQFDSTGNKIFCKQYVQGGFFDACYALKETQGGNIIITGIGTTKKTDINGNPFLWYGLGMNTSISLLPDESIVFTSDYGINSQIRIIKTDSLLSPPCYSFNYNPPQQVTITDEFLPLTLNEISITSSDSAISTTFFNFNLLDSLYCLTATNIIKHELNHDISISPNPFIDYISVVNEGNLIINQLDIYDLAGRFIKTSKYSNEKLNLSYLKQGIYFIKIVSKDKSIIQLFKICKIN